jgi:hypothetical protein
MSKSSFSYNNPMEKGISKTNRFELLKVTCLRTMFLLISILLLWTINYFLYKVNVDLDPTDESMALLSVFKPESNSIFPFNAITHQFFLLNMQNIGFTRTSAITLFQFLAFINIVLAMKTNVKKNNNSMGKVALTLIAIPLSFISTNFFYSGFYMRFPSYDWLNAIAILLFLSYLQCVYLINRTRNCVSIHTISIVIPALSVFLASFSKPTTSVGLLLILFFFHYREVSFIYSAVVSLQLIVITVLLFLTQFLFHIIPQNILNLFYEGFTSPKWVPNNTLPGALVDLIKFPIYPYYLFRNNEKLFYFWVPCVFIISFFILKASQLRTNFFFKFAITSFFFIFSVIGLYEKIILGSYNRAIFVSYTFMAVTLLIIKIQARKGYKLPEIHLFFSIFFCYLLFGFGSAHGVGVRSFNFIVVILLIALLCFPFIDFSISRISPKIFTLYSASTIVIVFFFISSYHQSFRVDLIHSETRLQISESNYIYTSANKAELFLQLKSCAKTNFRPGEKFVSLFYRAPWFVTLPFNMYEFPVLGGTLMGSPGSLSVLEHNSVRYGEIESIVVAVNSSGNPIIAEQTQKMKEVFFKHSLERGIRYKVTSLCKIDLNMNSGNPTEGVAGTEILLYKKLRG